jgi:hypothetical protein
MAFFVIVARILDLLGHVAEGFVEEVAPWITQFDSICR